MPSYLTIDDLDEIHQQAIDIGIHESRKTIIGSFPAVFSAKFPKQNNDEEQLRSDLQFLNKSPLLENGDNPLVRWLRQAIVKANGFAPTYRTFFEAKIRKIDEAADDDGETGASDDPQPLNYSIHEALQQDLIKLINGHPELKETIIGVAVNLAADATDEEIIAAICDSQAVDIVALVTKMREVALSRSDRHALALATAFRDFIFHFCPVAFNPQQIAKILNCDPNTELMTVEASDEFIIELICAGADQNKASVRNENGRLVPDFHLEGFDPTKEIIGMDREYRQLVINFAKELAKDIGVRGNYLKHPNPGIVKNELERKYGMTRRRYYCLYKCSDVEKQRVTGRINALQRAYPSARFIRFGKVDDDQNVREYAITAELTLILEHIEKLEKSFHEN